MSEVIHVSKKTIDELTKLQTAAIAFDINVMAILENVLSNDEEGDTQSRDITGPYSMLGGRIHGGPTELYGDLTEKDVQNFLAIGSALLREVNDFMDELNRTSVLAGNAPKPSSQNEVDQT